jgi:hypothetical protein
MPSSFEALAILLILLPGFLAAYILQSLATRPKQTDLERVIEALIFSLLIYLVYILTSGTGLPVSWRLEKDAAGNPAYTVEAAWRRLTLLTLVLPVLLGIVSAWLVEHDLLLRVLRFCKLTERTSRSSTWIDVMTEINSVAQVELADGRKVMGWITYYSVDPDDSSLFLEEAAWVSEENEGDLVPIKGPGILLTKEAGIRSVTFLDEPENAGEAATEKTEPPGNSNPS